METRIKRKIFQMGKYSYVITLPKELVRELGWQRGETVEIDFNKNKKQVIIKKYKF